MEIAYFGPEGTFTQQAACHLAPDAALLPFTSIEDIFGAVADGRCDGGVVPFENTTEGAVNETLDALLFGPPLFIAEQVRLPIRHCLMTHAAYDGPITKILSHPQSLAQCRHYLREHFEGVETLPAATNGDAARRVSESGEPWAAIGPAFAAARYGLQLRVQNIQDQPHNFTSFIRITRETQAKPLRSRRTSVAFSTYNKPGELYRMLSVFDVYRVNMTKILSRPMKNAPGEYVFLIDIEDYVPRDAARGLTLIRERTPFYRFLGSYPVKS